MTAVIFAPLAVEIRREHEAAQAAASKAVTHALRCGELLLEVKAGLEHGQFGAWLEANVDFSPRTARGYMRLAGLDESKRQRVADMSLRSVLASLAVPRDPGTLKSHPARTCPPDIVGPHWEQFCDSIMAHGLISPIVMCDGMVLDGWQRLRACLETGTEPQFREFDPEVDGDPLAFVVSVNVVRQHFTSDQRAMIAARIVKGARDE